MLLCCSTLSYSREKPTHAQEVARRISVAIYFASLLSNLYHKNTKNIYLILLSLSDLTFASGREGINNPFIVLVASSLLVCVGAWDF